MSGITRTARSLLAGAAALAVAAGLAVSGPAAAGTTPDPGPAPAGGLSVTGETAPIHDPALIVDADGTWYTYSTGLLNRENGGTVQIWSSHDDGASWEYEGTVWDQIPAWIDEHFSGGALPENLWAPEIYLHDGTYYLYYSASRFGTDFSVTALATNTTLDPDDPDYEWVDRGPVITSPGTIANGKRFNAIDAGVVEGADGTPYMAIGSHWDGIFLVELQWPSGKLADGALDDAVHLVKRLVPGNPVEAPYIYERGGWYYLFVSFDRCCAGADSTYKVAVGRSRDVTGPYLDALGLDMTLGGGTVVLDRHGAMVGPGGQSVFGDVLAFHYYDAADEQNPYIPRLGLHRLAWTEAGWPVVDKTVKLPAVTSQPADATARVGASASFSVGVSGTPVPVVTWETSDDGGATFRSVPGSASLARDGVATLGLEGVKRDQHGLLVRAQVENAHGSVTSVTATLSVRTKPHTG